MIDKVRVGSIAKSIMEVHFRTTEPLLVLGEPGIGKTEILIAKIKELLTREFGKTKGFNVDDFWTIIDGSGMPSESLVVPYIDNDNVDRLQRDVIPEFKKAKAFLLKKGNEDKKFVVFIDELSSFTQDDQRTIMNFVQSGLLPDGTMLPNDRIWVVCAGNPPRSIPGFEESDSPTHDIESAIITRCATYFVEADLDSWLEWGSNMSEKGRTHLHPYLLAALKKLPELYNTKDKEDVRYLINRSGYKLSQYLYEVEDMKEDGFDIHWEQFALNSYVGAKIGTTLGATLSNLDKIIAPKELFGDDSKDKISKAMMDKFKTLQGFERYYLLMRCVVDDSPINYKKENNVLKLSQLISEGELPVETGGALADFILTNRSNKSSNAARFMDNKILMKGGGYNVIATLMDFQDQFRGIK
jgi:moxR-like ATPase